MNSQVFEVKNHHEKFEVRTNSMQEKISQMLKDVSTL